MCIRDRPSRAENPVKASPDRFSLAVECVKRFEGWHGEKKHWPYVGWGHKVLPGERFTNSISKAQGDSILREDLRKDVYKRQQEYITAHRQWQTKQTVIN